MREKERNSSRACNRRVRCGSFWPRCRLPSLLAECPCFFFNDTATTEIYTLSLHDALPIFIPGNGCRCASGLHMVHQVVSQSEEHTSELQSPCNLVCRLLLEKKKLINK